MLGSVVEKLMVGWSQSVLGGSTADRYCMI